MRKSVSFLLRESSCFLAVIDLALQLLAASAAKHILLLGRREKLASRAQLSLGIVRERTQAFCRTTCSVVLFVFAVFAYSLVVQICAISFILQIGLVPRVVFFALDVTSFKRAAALHFVRRNRNHAHHKSNIKYRCKKRHRKQNVPNRGLMHKYLTRRNLRSLATLRLSSPI